MIDAGNALPAFEPRRAAQLHYGNLLGFRDRFLEQVNTMPKDLAVSDRTVAAVRGTNWDRWVPDELRSQARLRQFLVDVFLSGNGALIYSSPFVEWSSSEAMRRARPRLLVARFGMRPKPKPFTGIAIFENQHKISRLPDVDDPEGSAVDALELARYTWLAAMRYSEQAQTIGLTIAERENTLQIIAPGSMAPTWKSASAIDEAELFAWLGQTLNV